MNRRIGAVPLAVQLVVDALKLSPTNPSFLDMRDAILKALADKLTGGQLAADEHARVRNAIWGTFARFGMGPGARSNGASLSGIVADFNTPVQQPVGPVGSVVRGEATPNLSIPDANSSGIASSITLAQPGTARRIKAGVDITHTFIGDLRVELATPSGRTAVLHDRVGQGQDDLITTFDSAANPALTALLAQPEPISGRWTLKVKDLVGQDVGKLNRWSLEIEA